MQIFRCDVCGDDVINSGDLFHPSDVSPHDLDVNLELCKKCWVEYDSERRRYFEEAEKASKVYLRDLLSKMRVGTGWSKLEK